MTKRSKLMKRSTHKKRSFRNKNNAKNTTKRIFFNNKKQRGGRGSYNIWETDKSIYPKVYGIDNKAVLFPVSEYGVPAGFFDPPVPSNGPNGIGPVNGPYLGGRRSKRKSIKRKSIKRSSIKRKSIKHSSKKNKRSYRKYRGGGNQSTLAPQPLVNLTRSLMGSAQETLNGFSGHTNSASLNPMPYERQPIDEDIKYLRTDFPNVAQDYNKADSYVSGI